MYRQRAHHTSLFLYPLSSHIPKTQSSFLPSSPFQTRRLHCTSLTPSVNRIVCWLQPLSTSSALVGSHPLRLSTVCAVLLRKGKKTRTSSACRSTVRNPSAGTWCNSDRLCLLYNAASVPACPSRRFVALLRKNTPPLPFQLYDPLLHCSPAIAINYSFCKRLRRLWNYNLTPHHSTTSPDTIDPSVATELLA